MLIIAYFLFSVFKHYISILWCFVLVFFFREISGFHVGIFVCSRNSSCTSAFDRSLPECVCAESLLDVYERTDFNLV